MISEPKFWSSWKGRIIRAIVLDGNYTKDEILKTTRLEKNQFEQALDELFQTGLIVEKERDRFWVNSSELCNEYRRFFEKVQETLADWAHEWRTQKKIDSELNHFFLEDKLLDEFSETLIEHANVETLVANPYVEQCHISNTLMSMSEKGINVKLVTRSPTEQKYPYQNQYQRKKQYLSKLSQKGVFITYDESVHAKLIVVDRRVAVISSMNFVAASSGGASWEAGLVTVQGNAVQAVIRSILNKI